MTDLSARRSDRTAEHPNGSRQNPYYGVEDAAESRSSGVGTRPGFRFISTGTAGMSSGPSAGGAGSSAFSMLAYFAAILCSLV